MQTGYLKSYCELMERLVSAKKVAAGFRAQTWDDPDGTHVEWLRFDNGIGGIDTIMTFRDREGFERLKLQSVSKFNEDFEKILYDQRTDRCRHFYQLVGISSKDASITVKATASPTRTTGHYADQHDVCQASWDYSEGVTFTGPSWSEGQPGDFYHPSLRPVRPLTKDRDEDLWAFTKDDKAAGAGAHEEQ